jgi:hypothetical protein
MLTGKTNEEKIWNYLTAAGLNACGTAGLMGNLYVESGLIPTNLQNTYEKKLGYTDAAYTAAVDSGAYDNFAKDSAGYGLAQWTYHTRKAALLAFAKAAGKSVGDLETQLAFLVKELRESFKLVHYVLVTATDVKTASNVVLLQFEKPADQSAAAKERRAGYGQIYYNRYAKGDTMTEQEARAKVVSIAQSYIGCKESDGSHKKIIDLYNSHKPLARGYAVKYTDAWCSTFASAVAIAAGLTGIIPTECGCEKHIALFKALGSWQENDAYVPAPGDYIFYDWQDGTNYADTDNTGAADHVGIVEKVSGQTITVIEGNYSNAVKRRTLAVNGRYIRGYGVPKYGSGTASAAPAAPAQTAKPTVTEKKAAEAARSLDKTLAGTYAVTAGSGLHIRNVAGSKTGSMVVLPCGTKVQNYGYYTEVNGVKWLYIQVTYQGVKYTGFSSGQYLRKQ